MAKALVALSGQPFTKEDGSRKNKTFGKPLCRKESGFFYADAFVNKIRCCQLPTFGFIQIPGNVFKNENHHPIVITTRDGGNTSNPSSHITPVLPSHFI